MSGDSRSDTKQTGGSRKVRARLEVDVYGDEPVKAWNDLWGRILTELTIAHAAAAGATREDEVETATKTAVQGVSRGRMQRG